MVDLKDLVDIEKIKETKIQLRNERILNARLSGWEEIYRYISSIEDGTLETKNQIEEEGKFLEANIEYLLGQIDILQMLKSFIVDRVELISPDHPLVQRNER